MKLSHKISTVAAAATLGLVPAAAIAHGPTGSHGNSQNAPGHSHSGNGNAKKYGKFCQGESRQHVSGQKGTPFSNCVNDMAKLANNSNANPHRVCSNESRQHVDGQKGTPYGACVKAAAKLRRSQHAHGGSN
ncbi:MAG: hypothetical protein ACJ764_08825 [Solirubrobacteraceae bacterium]